MTKLDGLRAMTKVVADTGDIEKIKLHQPEDATTNPSLLLKAAMMPQYQDILKQTLTETNHYSSSMRLEAILYHLAVNFGVEILGVIPGRVSTEVDARFSFDTDKTIQAAKRLIELYEARGIARERILIKIAATWEGIQAAEMLEKEGIHCNLTLIFHIAQAVKCAQANVTLISPFVGRITDWYKKALNQTEFPSIAEDEGVQSVKAIYSYFKTFNYNTTVMGASFRHVKQVEALSGCDALTISPELLSELDADQGELKQHLSNNLIDRSMAKIDVSESNFRWALNDSAMATEKLAEGIRNFAIDTVKLEKLVNEKMIHGKDYA
ncbi:transaldolase [Thiotrichales bacterium 19S3-7]|nr:transaldolase [Thiotrichales bacterium 19S3-7]MCF6801770.1 transaldolase [Thiotrichales bacterium 19S3-11]